MPTKIICYRCDHCGTILKTAQGIEKHENNCNSVYHKPFVKNKIKLKRDERKTTN